LDGFTEYTNIITKLKWKLITEVIKRPSEEACGWIGRESKLKRSVNFEMEQRMFLRSKY